MHDLLNLYYEKTTAEAARLLCKLRSCDNVSERNKIILSVADVAYNYYNNVFDIIKTIIDTNSLIFIGHGRIMYLENGNIMQDLIIYNIANNSAKSDAYGQFMNRVISYSYNSKELLDYLYNETNDDIFNTKYCNITGMLNPYDAIMTSGENHGFVSVFDITAKHIHNMLRYNKIKSFSGIAYLMKIRNSNVKDEIALYDKAKGYITKIYNELSDEDKLLIELENEV